MRGCHPLTKSGHARRGLPAIISDVPFFFPNREFPLSLIKKGALSSIFKADQDEQVLLIDAHTNPGFSGGPVIFERSGQPKAKLRVGGIVSGYRVDLEPVLLQGTETPLTVAFNTGIVIAYGITPALRMIKANPNGIHLDQAQNRAQRPS